MDVPTLWRAASIQFVAVLLLAGALGAALPRSFFEDWGWIAGPASWMLCAAITSWFVRLPLRLVLLGAALAGLRACSRSSSACTGRELFSPSCCSGSGAAGCAVS